MHAGRIAAVALAYIAGGARGPLPTELAELNEGQRRQVLREAARTKNAVRRAAHRVRGS